MSEDKKAIRKSITAQKKAMSLSEISVLSNLICTKFMEQDFYRDADVIYMYAPYNQEILTWPILEDAVARGKKVAVPKCFDDVMDFFFIESRDELAPGAYGIPEPEGDPSRLADEKNVLILMPGLAFDRSMGRIGYGGGFYDKYLDAHSDASFLKVALAYSFQILEDLPVEEHDYRVDAIVTPKEIIK